MTTLEGESLSYHYRTTHAIDGLSFQLRRGITGLVGANGAGKSTLLRMLAGTMPCAAGTLLLDGIEATPEDLRSISGYVPQEFDFPKTTRVRDFLLLSAWLQGVPRSARDRRVDQALMSVNLNGRGQDRIGNLSGGMKRRLLFAQSSLQHGRILLLDEPTAGLDPEQRINMRRLIHSNPAEITIVSSHLIEEVANLSDHLLILEEGKRVFEGTPRQLLSVDDAVTRDTSMGTYEQALVEALRKFRASQ